MKNKVVNKYKPVLKSYVSGSYQEIFINKSVKSVTVLNQSEEYWDLDVKEDVLSEIKKRYDKQNRPMSIDDYRKLFLEKLNMDFFKQNEIILNDFFNDFKKLFEIFKKLDEIGIEYSLDLTGGAVRDFILNKEIKDLDIMLSIQDSAVNFDVLKKMGNIDFLKKNFEKNVVLEYLEKIMGENQEISDDMIRKKQDLVNLCFGSYVEKKYGFTSSNRIQTNVTKDYNKNKLKPNRLLGVFKLNREKLNLNYDVDILLTSFNKNEFLKDFDLEICKASFSLKNHLYKVGFPEDYLQLISRFSSDVSFWADVHNKKITLNVDGMTNEAIEFSIKKHYKRLSNKYSDYSLNIIGGENFKDQLIFANAIVLDEKIKINPIVSEKKMKL